MNISSNIIIILAVILINAIFVLSEMSVASSRKARLQQRANDGDRRAGTALKLIQNPNLFLSTVQIGITLVGVLVGAIGALTLSGPITAALMGVPMLRESANTIAIAIVVITI